MPTAINVRQGVNWDGWIVNVSCVIASCEKSWTIALDGKRVANSSVEKLVDNVRANLYPSRKEDL